MDFDIIIVGGSFAGQAAAIQLGRARRRVLLLDAGQPRNRFAQASHGFFLGQDGQAPAAIMATTNFSLRSTRRSSSEPGVLWRFMPLRVVSAIDRGRPDSPCKSPDSGHWCQGQLA